MVSGDRPHGEPPWGEQDSSRAVFAHLSATNERPEAQVLRGPRRQVKLSTANRTHYRRRFPLLLRPWKDRTKGGVRGVTSFRGSGTWLKSHFWTPCSAPLASGTGTLAPPPPSTGAAFGPRPRAASGPRPAFLRGPPRAALHLAAVNGDLQGAGERHSARSWQDTDIDELESTRSHAVLRPRKLTLQNRPWTPLGSVT